MRQVRQEALGIQEYTVPANRLYDRHAIIDQLLPQIFNLPNPGMDMVIVDRLKNTDGHGLHIASGKSSVGNESLEEDPVEGSVVVAIDDEGPGLPEELRHDVWVPEFTTKRRGTGLGLALVRRTVELHGGRATAEDRPEGGARFEVRLPIGTPDGNWGGRQ